MNATVFIGGGRITSALIAGLRLGGYRHRIVVHDHNPAKLRKLSKQYGITPESDLQRAVRIAKLLVIAVRPDSVAELLQNVGSIDRPLVAVSLAAGIPLTWLRARLGGPVRWARAMPSPVCRTGNGLTALTFPRGFPTRDRRLVQDFFRNVGTVLEIPESQFDAFTVTYSSSHGYHALATLAQAAEKIGLARKHAIIAAAHALADGILSWRESDMPLDDLIGEAATPGGIAAAVMQAMDDAGYPRIVQKALRAGVARARANARS